MSMLSAQVEELRKAAQTYRTLGNHELELMLCDAADTIWGLRNRLAGMVDMREHARIAETENAKLRELVLDMVDYGEGADSGMADWFADRMRELGFEGFEVD